MKKPVIVKIQKFSVHDGDGIRTTIFFKGCMLKCRWCHNPESQGYQPELMFNREGCTGCGCCSRECPHDAISISDEGTAFTDIEKCRLCSVCLDYCPGYNREIAGQEYTLDELMRIAKNDVSFYEESGGGVTLSGGEVMTQDMDFLEELCIKLKEEGINVAVDTCGYGPEENFQRLLPYVDTFLYDIKTLDDEAHKKYMGQSNQRILANLEFLAAHRACINVRIPVVAPVNGDVGTITDIIGYLKEKIGIVKVNLLPYHSTGCGKYDKLGRVYPTGEFTAPDQEHMELLKSMFELHGFNHVKIGG